MFSWWMILLVDNEGPDQADLGLRCPHMHEEVFAWPVPYTNPFNSSTLALSIGRIPLKRVSG